MRPDGKMKGLQVLPTLSAGGAEGLLSKQGVSLAELGCEVRFFCWPAFERSTAASSTSASAGRVWRWSATRSATFDYPRMWSLVAA